MTTSSVDVADYDGSGYDYREYWTNRQYDDAIERRLLESILPTFGNSFIDIGGGYGRLLDVYHDRFKHITITDYSQKNLQAAQAKIASKGLHHVATQHANVYEMPFKDKSFDAALMIRVLHHLERPSLALHEINRILTPGGIFVLQFANKIHLKNRLKNILPGTTKNTSLSPKNISENGIFYQFHPTFVEEKLKENGFTILKSYSTNNLRIPFVYNHAPTTLLVGIDRIITPLFSRYNLGPSIFIVAEKQQQ